MTPRKYLNPIRPPKARDLHFAGGRDSPTGIEELKETVYAGVPEKEEGISVASDKSGRNMSLPSRFSSVVPR